MRAITFCGLILNHIPGGVAEDGTHTKQPGGKAAAVRMESTIRSRQTTNSTGIMCYNNPLLRHSTRNRLVDGAHVEHRCMSAGHKDAK